MIHRRNWLWWLIGAAAFFAAMPAIVSVLTGFGVAVIYLISLHLHPFMTCRKCSGGGRSAGKVFGYAHRQCASCGGQGRHRRLGTVFFHASGPVWAERHAVQARETRRARPRP